MAAQQSSWLRTTLTLVGVWALATLGVIVLLIATKLTFPNLVAKAGPFLLAGYATGWLVPVSARRPKIIAAAVLVLVSALTWTAFGVISHDASMDKAPVLFGASLPVMVVASLWAYFGMYLGGRRHEEPPTTRRVHGDAELDDLEKELRNESTSKPAA